MTLPSKDSTDGVWIKWHQDLMAKYVRFWNKSEALPRVNRIFLAIWKKNGSFSANTANLRAYLKANDLSLDSPIDFAFNVADEIQNKIVMVLGIGLGIAIFAWLLLKKGEKMLEEAL